MSTFATIISRALGARRRRTGQPDVHFHRGSNGPYVCEHAACDSPGLDPSER